jgi:hypothetical protein
VSPCEFRAALVECPGAVVREDGSTNVLAGETLRRAEQLASARTEVSLIHRGAIPGREDLSRRVERRTLADPQTLLTHALRPWAPACYRHRWVRDSNFVSAGIVVCDIDEGEWGPTVDRLRSAGLAFSGYTTRNHGRPKVTSSGVVRPPCDRFRVVLWLSSLCRSSEEYTATLRGHARELGLPIDPSATDGSRYFYPRPATGHAAWGEGRRLAPVRAEVRSAASNPPPLVTEEEPADWPRLSERIRRAKAYLEKVPAAIEGRNGDDATVRAIRIPWDFGITDPELAVDVLAEWNSRCQPPWEGDEWAEKVHRLHRGRGPAGAKLKQEPRGTRLLGNFGDVEVES